MYSVKDQCRKVLELNCSVRMAGLRNTENRPTLLLVKQDLSRKDNRGKARAQHCRSFQEAAGSNSRAVCRCWRGAAHQWLGSSGSQTGSSELPSELAADGRASSSRRTKKEDSPSRNISTGSSFMKSGYSRGTSFATSSSLNQSPTVG